jgi:hypothetical protein
MTLSTRDRRALAFLGVSTILGLVVQFWPESTATPPGVVAPVADSDQAEKRLARLREIAASVPAKEAVLKSVSAELALREKGLLRADTAAQAQAQMLQLLRRLASAEMIDIRTTELGPMVPFAGAYGAINVSVQMECRIEQLINLLAAIGQQPELLSTSDLRIASGSVKEKTMAVRLTVTGLMPAKAVPAKKGGAL